MVRVRLILNLLVLTQLLAAASHAESKRPNILLIVADDLGFSDLGCYGGEIHTPALDRLAKEGVRFVEYHVNPMCVVTRTSLMTGQTHSQSDEYRRSIPLAQQMREAGYATSISGKWHQPGHPLDAGFERFYGFLEGEINSWTGFNLIREGRGQPGSVPKGWYSTDAFTDHAIQSIDAALASKKPFFSYLAYNAPHSPLHAPRENVERYYGTYDRGWEAMRQDRYKQMLDMGIITRDYHMSPAFAEARRWEELSPQERKVESRRMAAYAGMVDRMDENIGRLMHHLREKNALEDTLVIFFSDNGGDYGNGDIATYDKQIPWDPDSLPHVSNGWGRLKNTPFRWYKSSAFEGGISSPLIVRWPDGMAAKPGSVLRQRTHVSDWYPTLLEIVGTTYPPAKANTPLAPLHGRSLLPLLNNPEMDEPFYHDFIFWEYTDISKGLVDDRWKIVSLNDGPWFLFDIARDPAESRDLARQHPEILAGLADKWYRFAREATRMPPGWRKQVGPPQQGWGLHRMRLMMPVVRADPAPSAIDVPLKTTITLEFTQPADFSKTKGKTIRLYRVGHPEAPVWQADPDASHAGHGQKKVVFDNLPLLQPDTSYYLLADMGWVRFGDKPRGLLNDGAYWYRFRTAP